ncbi:MAG: class I SAM-dependent methyltransferase [Deltaproteobacteria bacterium]|nr:class I SAM-dependent methyltransferase [Deltaproteobacteria bacterium]
MAMREAKPVERYRIGLELLGSAKDKVILDAGCGFGTLEQFIPAFGIDRNFSNLQKTKQQQKFINATLDQIPLPDAVCDAVLMLETLEHVSDDKKVLLEIHRVLKNQGRLILSVPKHHFVYNWIDLEHWLVPLVTKRAPHRRYKKKDLHQKLDESGFVIDRCFTRGMLIAACMRWIYAPFDLVDYFFLGGLNGPFGKTVRKIGDSLVDWEFRIPSNVGGSLFIVGHKEI